MVLTKKMDNDRNYLNAILLLLRNSNDDLIFGNILTDLWLVGYSQKIIKRLNRLAEFICLYI